MSNYKAQVYDGWDRCYDYLHNPAKVENAVLGVIEDENDITFELFHSAHERLIDFYNRSPADRFTEFYVVDIHTGKKTQVFPGPEQDLKRMQK